MAQDRSRRGSRGSIGGYSVDSTGVQMQEFGLKPTNSSTETLTKLTSRDSSDVENHGRLPVVANMEDMALKALHVDDDPTLSPWTFRMFFLGSSLSLPSDRGICCI